MLRDCSTTPPANRADPNTSRDASLRQPGARVAARRSRHAGLTGLGSAACFVGVALALLGTSPSCGLDAEGLGGGPGGQTTTQGGGGAAAQCSVPEECSGTDTACYHRMCTQGLCNPELVVSGTACQENGGQVCDGNGTCVECVDPSQCSAVEQCSYHQCVPSHCFGGELDPGETDVDCGGPDCAPCVVDQHCSVATDCQSGFCDWNGGAGGSGGGLGGGICHACSEDGQCTGGPPQWCDLDNVNGGTCTAKKNLGDPCGGGNQCVSGFCPDGDGICCDHACDATCQACMLIKTGQPNGTCALVPGGQDPDHECSNDPPCGATGSGCNGTSTSCVVVSGGVQCAAPSCVDYLWTAAQTCNGAGQCVGSQPVPCVGNFVCADAQSCRNSCGDISDCVSGYYCDGGGACAALKADGLGCGGDQECVHGHCAPDDHVCCNAACGGTCQSCIDANNGGHGDGHCDNVPDGQDPYGECGNKRCDGNGHCH
jgi:hypothetical protein